MFRLATRFGLVVSCWYTRAFGGVLQEPVDVAGPIPYQQPCVTCGHVGTVRAGRCELAAIAFERGCSGLAAAGSGGGTGGAPPAISTAPGRWLSHRLWHAVAGCDTYQCSGHCNPRWCAAQQDGAHY